MASVVRSRGGMRHLQDPVWDSRGDGNGNAS